jgi:hypothetical protein
MKFIISIMAGLLLVLNNLPCADMDSVSCKTKAHGVNPHQQQQEQDGCDDDCSPFCHCTCCAVFSMDHVNTSFQLVAFTFKSDHSSFPSFSPCEISLPVWQPPQLAV